MSRIGKLPVNLPSGVSISVDDANVVSVKGPLGTLSQKLDRDITIEVENNQIIVARPNEEKRLKSLHGLYRALIANMVVGVTTGYKKELELVGVGYRAEANGQRLEMSLGYSHDIVIELPRRLRLRLRQRRGVTRLLLSQASTSSSSAISQQRSDHCVPLSLIKARVSNSWVNSSGEKPVNRLVCNMIKQISHGLN